MARGDVADQLLLRLPEVRRDAICVWSIVLGVGREVCMLAASVLSSHPTQGLFFSYFFCFTCSCVCMGNYSVKRVEKSLQR